MSSEKLAKDFMHPLCQYYHVTCDAPVLEALNWINEAMRNKKPRCLVVVDEENSSNPVVRGFVTPAELVFGLSSRFLKGARTSGPIFWEGQFEVECVEGIGQMIKDIMSPIKGFIRDSEMIMESIFLLNKYQADFLPVVHHDDVVGIVHLEDILKEISRIVSRKDRT